MSSSSRAVGGPATLQQRLDAMRNKRIASRFSRGIRLAAWTSVFTAVLVVVGGGLLNGH
jgi:hypothetical protein